jgi:CubicO group peptidase (beta-lactamase class C family)
LSVPEALLDELRRELGRLQRKSPAPSVSAALFRGDEVLWSEAIGLADVEAGQAAAPDTQYAIASITKTFVAASILLLRDEGALALDDPLGRYIEEADREGVTLRRMLAHLSGIQREAPGEVWETLQMPDREELLGGLGEAEQVLDPGAHWHYSNLAFALLGEVIQRASGIRAEQFVEERLLRPQGLERTTWGPGSNAATGYYVERFADVAHPEPAVEKRALSPAGGLWSTTGDLARWASYLMEQEEMHALQVMADPERWLLGWGLGLMLYRRGERVFAGHDGGTVGHASHLSYAREERVGIALLTNTENPSLDFDPVALTEKVAEALPAEPEPWRPGEPVPAELTGILGSWWSEGTEWRFEWREGNLRAIRPGWPVKAEFEREREDVYRTVSGRERGELLRIIRGEGGEPTKLYWANYPITRQPKSFGA